MGSESEFVTNTVSPPAALVGLTQPHAPSTPSSNTVSLLGTFPMLCGTFTLFSYIYVALSR